MNLKYLNVVRNIIYKLCCIILWTIIPATLRALLTYTCLRCCTMFAQTFMQLIYSWSGSALNSKHSWFQIHMSVDVHSNKHIKCVVLRHHFFFSIYTVFFFLKDVVSCVQNLPLHYCLYPDSENQEAISKKAVKSVIANCFTRFTLFYPNRLAYTQARTVAPTAHKGGPIWRGCFYVCACVCYKVHFSFGPPLGPGLHLLPSISQMSCVLLTLLTAWKKWTQTIYLFVD